MDQLNAFGLSIDGALNDRDIEEAAKTIRKKMAEIVVDKAAQLLSAKLGNLTGKGVKKAKKFLDENEITIDRNSFPSGIPINKIKIKKKNDTISETLPEGNAGRTSYRDPQPPGYDNGKIHMDHEDAKVWGNKGEANRELPAETNMRRGGHDAKLYQDYKKLVNQFEKSGVSPSKSRKMARAAVQEEIDALKRSPPPRPMDPGILDQLPENPLDQSN